MGYTWGMNQRFLRTTDIAQGSGVHPNTVRLYETWGYLPPVPRASNGYRRFTEAHLDQMRLARTALQWPYPGGKESVIRLVKSAAHGEFGQAMEAAHTFLDNVRAEQAHADAAVAFLEQWAGGQTIDPATQPLRIGAAARRLSVTTDMLRGWERNGLLRVPRHPCNSYRLYGTVELGRARVIRVLRQSGYSMMSILRMMLQFDAGHPGSLRAALDTPRPDEDVYHVTDRWLTTLSEAEARALDLIQMLAAMTTRHGSG